MAKISFLTLSFKNPVSSASRPRRHSMSSETRSKLSQLPFLVNSASHGSRISTKSRLLSTEMILVITLSMVSGFSLSRQTPVLPKSRIICVSSWTMMTSLTASSTSPLCTFYTSFPQRSSSFEVATGGNIFCHLGRGLWLSLSSRRAMC